MDTMCSLHGLGQNVLYETGFSAARSTHTKQTDVLQRQDMPFAMIVCALQDGKRL